MSLNCLSGIFSRAPVIPASTSSTGSVNQTLKPAQATQSVAQEDYKHPNTKTILHVHRGVSNASARKLRNLTGVDEVINHLPIKDTIEEEREQPQLQEQAQELKHN